MKDRRPDLDPRRNHHMGESIPILTDEDENTYSLEVEGEGQAVPQYLEPGKRIAVWHNAGWMVCGEVVSVGERYFEIAGTECVTVLALYSGEWRYADDVSIKAPNTTWRTCEFELYELKGKAVTCGRGHSQNWLHKGPSYCDAHDKQAYLRPATREPMKREVVAEYEDLFAAVA